MLKEENDIGAFPIQRMINYSALYDTLMTNNKLPFEDIYGSILKDEQDITASIAYFFDTQDPLFEKKEEETKFPLNRVLLAEIAQNLGYQKFVLYMFLGKNLGNVFGCEVDINPEGQNLISNLGVLYQELENFPETLLPEHTFRPTMYALESFSRSIIEDRACTFLLQESIEMIIAEQIITPMSEKQHIASIQSFISKSFAKELATLATKITFYRKEHNENLFDYDIDKGPLLFLLEELLNSPQLRSVIAKCSGLLPEQLKRFGGRIYRIGKQEGFEDWHQDCTEENKRILGFSLNLSLVPYEGGALAVKYSTESEPCCVRQTKNIGDAMIFRLAPNLRHRVMPITSETPRLAFVGWFTGDLPYCDVDE